MLHAFPRIPLARALVSALLISGLLVQPLAAQGVWELDPEETSPTPREKHTLTQISQKIYCFGGKDASGTALNDLWAYNFATQSWSQLTPTGTPPPARHSHQAVELNGQLLILFGKGAAGTALNDIWRYDPTTNAWDQRPSTGSPLPDGRYDFSAAKFSNSRITIYGGYTSDGVFADAYAWNYSNLTTAWTQRAANPAGPVAEAQFINYLDPGNGQYHDLAFGGNTPTGVSNLVHHYDPSANSWSQIAMQPGSDIHPGSRGYTVAVGKVTSDQANGLALLAMIFGGQDANGDLIVNAFALRIALSNLQIVSKNEGALPVGLTGAAAALANPDLNGALRDDWAKNYAWQKSRPPVVEWDARTQRSTTVAAPGNTTVPAVCVSGVSPRGDEVKAVTASTHTGETPVLQPARLLSLLKPGALLKAALPAALALPSLSITGNGADGTPLSEFLVFGGRVNGVVSAQQVRLTVGNIYFPPTVVKQSNGLLRISWPDSIIGGVTLQESATLTPANSWANVPGAPTHGTGIYYLDVDPASYNGGKHFFRLKAP